VSILGLGRKGREGRGGKKEVWGEGKGGAEFRVSKRRSFEGVRSVRLG
jgi:hypothetical protein